ncbi:hypothetical protein B0H19DRAFT_293448 [Mycena capillaripes]|nr:hypothetical protein B0H19DRAFT_293448 [Mycena capillaripes]
MYPSCPPLTGILSPNILTQICAKWREIALFAPVLWRAISLEYDQLRMVKAWLSRSGNYPLSFQMNEYAWTDIPILEALIAHRARWEYVELHIEQSQALTFIEGPLPLLRELEIRVGTTRNEKYPSFAFRQVPNLTTATLWDFDYPAALFPWSQLTSMNLIAKTPSECTAVLKQTSNLVYCELTISSETGTPEPDIHLPHLETLVFVNFTEESESAAGYLPCFVVPALRRLQLPSDYLGDDPIASLTSFISKSGCNLEEVHITGERSLPKSVYREAFPSIRTISFNKRLTDWCGRGIWRETRSLAEFASQRLS